MITLMMITSFTLCNDGRRYTNTVAFQACYRYCCR